MRLVQDVAIDLFETGGYDVTTIEAIADASGVSAATIYRHFGNKESIVLWDEQDRTIDAELGARLGRQPPLEAFRDAAIAAYGGRTDSDELRRRLKLVYTHPTILGVAAQDEARHRAELADAIAQVDGRSRRTINDGVIAAIALAALDVAFTHWQSANPEQRLVDLIAEAFAAVTGP